MNRTRLWYLGSIFLLLFVFSYAQIHDNNPFQIIKKTKNLIHSVTDKHSCIKEHFFYRTVVIGDTAKFCVRKCEESFKYQWYKDGDSIKGENKPYLVIANIDFSDEGKYWCWISSLQDPDCGNKIDTIQLVVAPYKGFDPTSISKLHLWFRDDKGLIIYNASGVPITPRSRSDYFCIDTTNQDMDNDRDDSHHQGSHDYFQNFTNQIEEKYQKNHCNDNKNSRQTLVEKVKNSIYDHYQDNDYCITNISKWNYHGCFHHGDIDIMPKEFTFLNIFNTFGVNCNIFENRFFKIYTRDSICYLRYENGVKDTLGIIKGLALFTSTRSNGSLVIQLNSNIIRTINISDCYSYFPSLRHMSFNNSFAIGCVPMPHGIWQGRISEFLLYSRALTATEYDQVRFYLISKYSNHLNDIWHSEWAYAPAFHPSISKYKAILPSLIDTLSVDVVKSSQDLPIKIAGQNPPFKIAHLNSIDSVSIMVETSMGSINYQINFERSNNYIIYVKQSATGSKTGTSWYDAYTDLQKALDDAGKSGKEIWVAEGIYQPSKRTDIAISQSSTFCILPGTKIVGGFKGTETEENPVGSPYVTVLNGDMLNNDENISDWPIPEDSIHLLNDNAYHVLTINGFINSKSIFLCRLSVKGGYASGLNRKNRGAGAIISCCPTLEFCGFFRNVSTSDGAGLFCQSLPLIDHSLFEDNISLKGRGAGFYINSIGKIDIDGCVFFNNSAEGNDTSCGGYGGGIFVDNVSVNFVNSIFVNNYASNSGGAIFGTNCGLTLKNCTIVNNDANIYSGGIQIIQTDTPLVITNSILWNNTIGFSISKDSPYMGDVNAKNLDITYTSLTYSISGTGNIVGNPQFVSINNPKGTDSQFGTLDDGLMLATGSKCIRAGSITDDPPEDLLGFNRATQEPSDLGAYYFQAVNSNVLGKYDDNGNFVPTVSFTVIDGLKSELTIVKGLQKGYHRLIQAELPKDKYTDKKNSVVVQVSTVTEYNSAIGKPINILLYRVGKSQFLRSYYWNNDSLVGKPILFTNNSAMAGEHNHAYVVEGANRCMVKIVLDKGQFN